MELVKGVTVDYAEGAVVLKAEVKALVIGEIEKIQKKVESGEIDLIKGTDLDKMAVMAVIEAIKKAL